MLADGHIHSPYCPHGTKDSFEKYIEKAIFLGLEEITFTEHAPLPSTFVDPTPLKDSAMRLEYLENYFKEITILKEKYHSNIKINRGLEVDYIEGYESETRRFLQDYGSFIDDSILSVHFLKHKDAYYCVDYSPEAFSDMISIFGGIEAIYQKYFETLLMSIKADLGPFKPKRIGHITLVHKFQIKYPVQKSFEQDIKNILTEMATHNLQLDYNGAGTAKPLCKEPYPPLWIIEEAIKINIPIVYGSDAHQAKDMGQGLDVMKKDILLSPTSYNNAAFNEGV
ncbi:histidinol-phosphatase HisJ [Bacillus suaedaesalsae]|uniref:Histidinol-phosphatase n=1 Tax=Bacillus suaedaesalsae TaxID=2810349 RepID=A0ABS2DG28_9BACI|nr:histidinol-phosphatase HisJ [Bacillus suaedaesalsae]MBM6617434.1 histidinol-phosphatase HisJ [Bacillus suaedaesalsae]